MRILLLLGAMLPLLAAGQIAIDVQLQLLNVSSPVPVTYTWVGGGTTNTVESSTDSLGFDQAYLPVIGMFNTGELTVSFVNCNGETVSINATLVINPAGGNVLVPITGDFCPGGGEGEGGGGDPAGCTASFSTTQALDAAGNPIPNAVWVVLDTLYANGQYMWDFGDEGSSTEFLPSHTYSGSGPYVLCATVTVPIENALCTAYHCDTLAIDEAGMLQFLPGFTIQVVVGNPGNVVGVVSEALETAHWNLFPNPVIAGAPLQWQAIGEAGVSPVRIEVIHADGSISHETPAAGSANGSLSTSGWPAGIHVVRFLQGDQIAIRRIIVQ